MGALQLASSELPNSFWDRVHDRELFFDFVSALADERRADGRAEKENPGSPSSPTNAGWENISIEDFLDAALRCATARSDRTPVEASWQASADFLYGGKIYE